MATPSLEELNAQYRTSLERTSFVAVGIARALSARQKDWTTFMATFDRLMPRSPCRDIVIKAATGAVTTGDVNPLGRMDRAFVEAVDRRSIPGRAIGIRRVPILTRMMPVAGGVSAAFVTEGEPIAVDVPIFGEEVVLMPSKVAKIGVFTEEAAASPDGVRVVERDLVRADADGIDHAFLDGEAGVAGGRPASILFGLSAVADSSSSTIEADVVALIEAVRGGEAEAPHLVTSASGALWLATRRASDGSRIFPDVTVRGGDILGIPLLISSAGTFRLVLFDAAAVLYADQGADLQPAAQTALQFRTDPVSAPQNLISLYQTDTLAIRAIHFVTWRLGVEDGAGFIELPAGSPGSPA